MGIIYGHLDSLEIEPKNTKLLRLIIFVVFPGEEWMLKLPLVGGQFVFVNFFRQVAAVRKLVIIDWGYTTIYVNKSTSRSQKLCSCDNVILDEKSSLRNSAGEVK